MAHPNAADKVFNQLFNGADPQGSVAQSYTAAILRILSQLDAAETYTTNPAREVVRQFAQLVGSEESLAVRDFARHLNTLRNFYDTRGR